MGFSLQSLGKVKMLTSHLDEFFLPKCHLFLRWILQQTRSILEGGMECFFCFCFFFQRSVHQFRYKKCIPLLNELLQAQSVIFASLAVISGNCPEKKRGMERTSSRQGCCLYCSPEKRFSVNEGESSLFHQDCEGEWRMKLEGITTKCSEVPELVEAPLVCGWRQWGARKLTALMPLCETSSQALSQRALCSLNKSLDFCIFMALFKRFQILSMEKKKSN